MHAQAGDWLLIHDHGTAAAVSRRAEIVGVDSPDGSPPYTVHWLDTDRTVLVFPGPDATVVSATELAELDRRARERFDRVQTEITARPASPAGSGGES